MSKCPMCNSGIRCHGPGHYAPCGCEDGKKLELEKAKRIARTPGPQGNKLIKAKKYTSETKQEKQQMSDDYDRLPEKQVRTFDTNNYHGHPRFYELLQEMADLHSRKNHDYAGGDPLSNLRAPEEIGIPAAKGIIVRLMDKWGRLKTFFRGETYRVKEESVKDTLMDNAVYSLLCIIVLEETEEKVHCPNDPCNPCGKNWLGLQTNSEEIAKGRLC